MHEILKFAAQVSCTGQKTPEKTPVSNWHGWKYHSLKATTEILIYYVWDGGPHAEGPSD